MLVLFWFTFKEYPVTFYNQRLIKHDYNDVLLWSMLLDSLHCFSSFFLFTVFNVRNAEKVKKWDERKVRKQVLLVLKSGKELHHFWESISALFSLPCVLSTPFLRCLHLCSKTKEQEILMHQEKNRLIFRVKLHTLFRGWSQTFFG